MSKALSLSWAIFLVWVQVRHTARLFWCFDLTSSGKVKRRRYLFYTRKSRFLDKRLYSRNYLLRNLSRRCQSWGKQREVSHHPRWRTPIVGFRLSNIQKNHQILAFHLALSLDPSRHRICNRAMDFPDWQTSCAYKRIRRPGYRWSDGIRRWQVQGWCGLHYHGTLSSGKEDQD